MERKKDGIEISMEDYAESLKEVIEIQKEEKDEPLTKIEKRVYIKYIGMLSWLVENYRPDLVVTLLNMSRRSSKVTLADLKKVNDVIKKVKEKRSLIKFGRIGWKKDIVVTRIRDASYKQFEKAIGGNIVLEE